MKELFGIHKDKEYISFPFDWLKPGEFTCELDGSWRKETMKAMEIIAWHRRDVEKLLPIFWMI